MVHQTLHQLLEQSKYDEALYLLKSEPASHPMTAEQHNLDLPLHTALSSKAPEELLLHILLSNEDAAYWKGRGSNIPLHIATTKNASADVIERLIRIYPQGLDVRNESGLTPREIGHSDPCALQSIMRPTSCWLEALGDEELEEIQDSRLMSLSRKVDMGLDTLKESDAKIESVVIRLKKIQEGMETSQELGPTHAEDKLSSLESTLIERFDMMENKLCTVEDNINSYYVGDFMAKEAHEATSSKVKNMRMESDQKAEIMSMEVREFKNMAVAGATE